jgi:hypothetical protein
LVETSPLVRGPWPLRPVPELEVTQDAFDVDAVIDQTDNFELMAAPRQVKGSAS